MGQLAALCFAAPRLCRKGTVAIEDITTGLSWGATPSRKQRRARLSVVVRSCVGVGCPSHRGDVVLALQMMDEGPGSVVSDDSPGCGIQERT